MARRHIDVMRIVMALIVVALLALLAAAIYYAWTTLEATDMPAWMYFAMGGGVLFSLIVGCGLMALMFYSSRHGYDERAASGKVED